MKSAEKKEKLAKAAGWGISAMDIIMKNNVVMSVCLLIQGLCYFFSPEGSLNWEFKLLTGLSALYALSAAIVILTSHNAKAEKGREMVDDLCRSYLSDKKDLFNRTRRHIADAPDNRPAQTAERQQEEALTRKTPKAPRGLSYKNQRFAAAVYLALFLVCAVLFFNTGFTVMAARVVLGTIITTEGAFSLFAVLNASRRQKLRGHIPALVFSAVVTGVGILLMTLPAQASPAMLRIIGAGLILMSLAELWVFLRSRRLIASGKDIITEIKNI